MLELDNDKISNLIFAVRHPEKPPDYDPQKAAEELANQLAGAAEIIAYHERREAHCPRCSR